MNPWLGIGFVLVMLAGSLATLRWYKRRYAPQPEWTRKLLHVGMGLTSLTLPWLFDRTWPVLLLVGLTVSGLWWLRRSSRLSAQWGDIICGVERQQQSLGEIYFPLGVAGVFILSGGDPLHYTIPILLLTLADAVAALVGTRYGQTFFIAAAEGCKSVEGSLAFFVVAFFSVHVPLLLFGQTGRTETLLISLMLALLVMLVEAVAGQGLDNLLIPTAGYVLLAVFLKMPAGQLAGGLTLTLVLLAFGLLWRKQPHLRDSLLIGAMLAGYLSWTLAVLYFI